MRRRLGSLLSRQTLDGDARYYLRLATNGVLAFRARGYKSWGEFPGYLYFGGNSELRGYDYLEFLGNKAFFLERRAALPADRSGADAARRDWRPAWHRVRRHRRRRLRRRADEGVHPRSDHRHAAARVRAELHDTLTYDPVYGPPKTIDGFKLVDGRASYGVGLETFALGFPIHFDWSWRTLMNKDYEDYVFAYQGIQEGETGSKWFRKPRFTVWIGYDF